MSTDKDVIRRLQNDIAGARFVTTAVHYYGTDKDQLASDIEHVLNRIAELELAEARYEYVRRLNPRNFTTLWVRNTNGGGPFDKLVDIEIAIAKEAV